MTCRHLVFFVLFVPLLAISQEEKPRWTGLATVQATMLHLLHDDLIETVGEQALFEEYTGPHIGVGLRKSGEKFDKYLECRFSFKSSNNEIQVPLINENADTVSGSFLTDNFSENSFLFDIEYGVHSAITSGRAQLEWGAGLYASVASSQQEYETLNNLSGYIGQSVSFDTRARGGAGLRPHLQLSYEVSSRWLISLRATYQAGFTFLPDITHRYVDQIFEAPVAIVQERIDQGEFNWVLGSKIVPFVSLHFDWNSPSNAGVKSNANY